MEKDIKLIFSINDKKLLNECKDEFGDELKIGLIAGLINVIRIFDINIKQIQAYVDFTEKVATKVTAIKIFLFAFIFAILDIAISYIIQSFSILMLAIFVSVAAIFLLIYAIGSKKKFMMI